MNKLKLTDISIFDIGNTYSLAGTIWSGAGRTIIAKFPEADLKGDPELLEMDYEDWGKLIRQSDIMEVEILSNDGHGLKRSIVRKSQRMIDDQIQWQVFKRDSYKCRYCGRDGVKLTVDHVILWEQHGPTIAINLITACRKCNKERGNLQYEDWLKSPMYLESSKGLDDLTRKLNEDILGQLEYLRSLKVRNIRSR